ncbi:MAG: hypothetical protein QW731_07740, partial [Thermofilaceae archaeon]
MELRIGEVERDLVLEDEVTVVPEGKEIRVKGSVICRGSCRFRGSLEAVSLKASGDVEIEGWLWAADNVSVDGALTVEGDIYCRRLRAENLEVRGMLSVEEASVADALVAGEIIANSVSAGDTLE